MCCKTYPKDNFYDQQQWNKAKDQLWKFKDALCKQCRIAYGLERRRQIKIKAVEYKGGKCLDCGLIDEVCVYDFHHTDPTKKDFAIGKQTKAFETMKSELDKCELLCSNCHRKRHLQI